MRLNKKEQLILKDIMRVTKEVAAGTIVSRIIVDDDTSELGALAWSINDVLDQIEVILRDSKSSIKAVSQGNFSRNVFPQGLHQEFFQTSTAIYEAIEENIKEQRLINKLNSELQEQITKKERILSDLKLTQNQMVEQEKMVALGQLIAGVAHEVNTPLGAMKSSSGSILESMNLLLNHLPQLFSALDARDKILFFKFLDTVAKQDKILSTREERKVKRQIAAQLADHDIEDAPFITDRLIDMKCYEDMSEFFPLFKHQYSSLIIETAYNISDLQFNVYNINEAIKRASKIIFALKSFARYDYSGEPVEADLVNGVDMALTIYANKIKKGVNVVTDYEEISPIICYEDELNQVWTNLIFNAIQAMNYSGTLTIRVSKEKNYIVISITDTGCGIPEAIKERIFEPFFTTKPSGEGSGLGLDIAKKVVEKHHGRIELTSEVDVGTTFKIYISTLLTKEG
jgi:signal transduction histidine kinase